MSILANLSGVPGMRGAAIYRPDGTCIESTLPAPYEPGYVHSLLGTMLVAFESLSFINDTPLRVFFARLSEGALAIGVNRKYQLAALAEPDVNPLMLNVAMGALENRLQRTTSLPAPVQPPSTIEPPRISPPSVLPEAADPFRPGASAMSLTSLTSGSASISLPSMVDDPVPVERIRGLAALAAKAIGPMAKMVVKREAKKLGYSLRAFPQSDLPQLVLRVGRRIERADLRATFEAGCRQQVL